MLRTPDAVSFHEVISALERESIPLAGRLGFLHLAMGSTSDAADAWGAEFTSMLEGVGGLCQANLLRPEGVGPEGSDERIALTFWETSEAMAVGGQAIAAWQATQASAGRAPAYVGTSAVALSDLLVGFAAATPAVAGPNS